MKKILSELKDAIANLRELAAEKTELEQRRAKAQSDLAAAAEEKITDKVEARITRASNVVIVCNARLAKLESGSEGEADQIRQIYLAARKAWNDTVAVRRELARAEFLQANVKFFSFDEKVTADRLAGILPLTLARIARSGWSGFWPPPTDPFGLLREIECFLSSVEMESAANGIPIE